MIKEVFVGIRCIMHSCKFLSASVVSATWMMLYGLPLLGMSRAIPSFLRLLCLVAFGRHGDLEGMYRAFPSVLCLWSLVGLT